MAIKNSVCEKVWFTTNGLSKILSFNLCFFHFSKFEMTIVKNLLKNQPFLKWISRVLMKFYYVKNIFDLHTFDNEKTDLFFLFFFYFLFMKKLSLFNANFQNSFQDILQNTRISNLVILKWRLFEC